MIEIEMNDDIREYEPAAVFVFSARQICCIGISLSYSIPIALLCLHVGIDIVNSIFIAALFAVPVAACGFVKVYGAPLEQILIQVIRDNILSPRKRVYKTITDYEDMGIERGKRTNKKVKRYKKIKAYK